MTDVLVYDLIRDYNNGNYRDGDWQEMLCDIPGLALAYYGHTLDMEEITLDPLVAAAYLMDQIIFMGHWEDRLEYTVEDLMEMYKIDEETAATLFTLLRTREEESQLEIDYETREPCR